MDRLDHRSDTPWGGCDRLQGRGYRVGGGYAQKETANRYLLGFSRDACLRTAVEFEQFACSYLRDLFIGDRGGAQSRVGDLDCDFHGVGVLTEGFRELFTQFVRFRQFFRHCD